MPWLEAARSLLGYGGMLFGPVLLPIIPYDMDMDMDMDMDHSSTNKSKH